MASIQRSKKTKYWVCSFYDHATKRWRLLSTKQTDKEKARSVCARMDEVSKSFRSKDQGPIPAENSGQLLAAGLDLLRAAQSGTLGEAEGRDFVNKLIRATGAGSDIEAVSLSNFATNWLAGKTLSTSKHTGMKYKTTVDMFIKHLGNRSKVSLTAISTRDIEHFRNARLKEVGASTVTDDLKILRIVFNSARRQGLVTSNPVEAVDLPKGEAQHREPFMPEDVTALVAEAVGEWKTAIMLGFYCGMRLGDAVKLSWDTVDLKKSTITFKSQKTNVRAVIPMHSTLSSHLESIAGDKSGLITPGLAKQDIPGRSGLSRQFLEIVKNSGIVASPEQDKKKGKMRRFTARSFHSLRHGFVSAMMNAGVSREIRMKLSGHTTESAHDVYSHGDIELLKQAVNSIK